MSERADTDIGEESERGSETGEERQIEFEEESQNEETENEDERRRENEGKSQAENEDGIRDENSELRRSKIGDKSLWRNYVTLFLKKHEERKANDKFDLGQSPKQLVFPNAESEEEFGPPAGCPINIFNTENRTKLPNRLNPSEKIRVWKKIGKNPPVDTSCFVPEFPPIVSKIDSGIWPGVWPCEKSKLEVGEKDGRRKRKKNGGDAYEETRDEKVSLSEPEDDFADHKELWHARIPPKCPTPRTDPLMIDHAVGLNESLVSGDYVLTDIASRKHGNRTYAYVCIRGLKGMHLPELHDSRARSKTWKWCFYPSMIALLVKTQLRYKYAWSGNVDYIYDRGWNLFTHVGNINVSPRRIQKFGEITVYNYKYDVGIELVQELKDIPRIRDVGWDYVERNQSWVRQVQRQDPTRVVSKFGQQKLVDEQKAPVHRGTNIIENWFDKLPNQYENCIFRTTKYSLAFWKEGMFWYLYNPYRCNEIGFWDDGGFACIVKFCSKDALRRHLMILLLRAYVYEFPESPLSSGFRKEKRNSDSLDDEPSANSSTETDGASGAKQPADVFILQIYQMIYNKCELVNKKLLERSAPTQRMRPIANKTIDPCPCDLSKQMKLFGEEKNPENVESVKLLTELKVTWTQCPNAKKKLLSDDVAGKKLRWHQYYVEEDQKLFSLWGEIHPTEAMFPAERRGKQAYACYVVCAGMTRIIAPEYWTSKTLDAIVMCGDRYYTNSTLEVEARGGKTDAADASNWTRFLARNFEIGETMFRGNLSSGTIGRLYVESAPCLRQALLDLFANHAFGTVSCENVRVGVFKFCGAYYMCDVNSIGPPLFQYGNGVIYLIRSTTFAKFMTTLVLTINSSECSEFEVNPIEISHVIDLGQSNPAATRRIDVSSEKKMLKNLASHGCPREEKGKTQCRKRRPIVVGGRRKRKSANKLACKNLVTPCEAAGYLKASKS